MAALSKPQLLQRVVEAIDESGWNLLYVSTTHPFKVNIYQGNLRYLTKIYIWNLSHGGGIKRPQNEYRIQVKVRENLEEEPGWITLLLGWWEDAGVFAGFDFRKHLGLPGWSSSIQIKEDALKSAYINGFATSDKGNQEIAIAFRPDFFVEYLQNLSSLHDFGQYAQDLQVLEDVVKDLEINDEDIAITDYERKSTAATVKRKLRDISFRKRVLAAYSYRCAFCGIQLKLVDAAHIVPVQENGSDETSNGIALCVLHHRAYDKGFVTVWDDYSVKSNSQYVANLRKINLDSGLDKFEKNLRPIIYLPPSVSDRPHVENIKIANRIRGW